MNNYFEGWLLMVISIPVSMALFNNEHWIYAWLLSSVVWGLFGLAMYKNKSKSIERGEK